MSVLAVSCNAFYRLCHESGHQAELVEHIPNYIPDVLFVVSRLHGFSVFPVDLKLFHDVVVVAAPGQLGLDASHFFVPHLHFKVIVIQYFQRFFKGCPDRTVSPLPVLLL